MEYLVAILLIFIYSVFVYKLYKQQQAKYFLQEEAFLKALEEEDEALKEADEIRKLIDSRYSNPEK